MNKTQVFIVADLSGSMSGSFEVTQRKLIVDMIKGLAAEESKGQLFELQLIGFSNHVAVKGPWPASAVPTWAINELNTGLMGGSTALRDAIGKALSSMDAATPTLISVFTDGEENASTFFSNARLRSLVDKLEATGNLTLTLAGPRSAKQHLAHIGIPDGNFRAWDGEVEQRAMVADTKSSIGAYVQERSAGRTASKRFYADTTQLTDQGVRGMTKKIEPAEIRKVTKYMDGRAVADFFGTKFKAGSHYYELIKPEYVQDDKELVIHIKDQNEYRQGSRAVRSLLGLPEVGKVRVHPGPHSAKYQIFVQSSSVNRKVVEGQTMLTV